MRHLARIAAFLIAVTAVVFSQTPYGRITGRVVDSSGALVASAPIRAMQVETNIVTRAATNSEGIYEFPNLLPGNYRIVVEFPGFKRVDRGPVELRVGDVLTVTLTLEPGDLAETVSVTAEAPLLELSTASVGQTMAGRQITDMASGGRAITYLLQLTPGMVTTVSPNSAWNPQGRGNLSRTQSTMGSGSASTEYTLDGIPNMDHNGTMMLPPPPDMIQEFRVQTAAFDASQGRFSGASVNMVVKQGTNQFHGALHYGMERRAFNSNPFFVNRALHDLTTGPPTDAKRDSLFPKSKTDRYRTSFAGPVFLPKFYDGRNRTFFSYGNEIMENSSPGSGFHTVPTANQREGDFSELLALGGSYRIYDPATIALTGDGRTSRLPFTGNVIPRGRLDPVAQKLVAFYPLPNTTGTVDGRNNFSNPPANIIKWQSHLGRIDQVISERQRMYASFSASNNHTEQYRDYRNDGKGLISDAPTRNLTLDDVLILSPSLVLNLRAGVNRINITETPVSAGIDLTSLGFSSDLTSQIPREYWMVPGINIAGYGVLNDRSFTWQTRTYTYTGGHVTYLRGSHTLKAGGEWRTFSRNRTSVGSATPEFEFDTVWTRGPHNNSGASPIGQGLASFMLGLPTGGSGERNASSAQGSHYTGFYLHDNWKVSRGLTLDLGLRYELEIPVTERFNRANRGFDFTTANPIEPAAQANYAKKPIAEIPPSQFHALGGLLFAGVGGVPRGMWSADTNNFLPRIGAAYQLRPTTIIRAGYGVFYGAMGTDRMEPPQAGFSQSTPIVPSLDEGLTFTGTLADPFPEGFLEPAGADGGLTTYLGRSVNFIQTGIVPERMQRWSATIQQQLSGRLLVEIGYTGNRGSDLSVSRNFNAVPGRYLSTSGSRDQAVINFLTQQVDNPFKGIAAFNGTNLAAAKVQRQQLLSPIPQFLGVNSTTSDGSSTYHQGHARLEKRMTHGFNLGGTYTWSKFMEATDLLNPSDALPSRVISSMDRPHRITFSGMWDLPWAQNKLWGGWSFSGMYQWQSGAPMAFGNVIFNGDLRDLVLPRSERTVERWFNTDAGFNRVSAQQLANNIRTFPLRLTGLRAGPVNSANLSLVKDFQIRESVRFQLRADAINAFNHAIFNPPNTVPQNSLFGQVSSTFGPIQRSFELIGRFTW